MSVINNVIVSDIYGVFDYQAEGFKVEVLEVFEDAIVYKDLNDDIVTANCKFEGSNAIIRRVM